MATAIRIQAWFRGQTCRRRLQDDQEVRIFVPGDDDAPHEAIDDESFVGTVAMPIDVDEIISVSEGSGGESHDFSDSDEDEEEDSGSEMLGYDYPSNDDDADDSDYSP